MNGAIPGIEKGCSDRRAYEMPYCYYFCDFDETLAHLRRKKDQLAEATARRSERQMQVLRDREALKREPAAAPRLGKRALDLTGQRFGMLTVVGFAGVDSGRNALWRCMCDCGRQVTFTALWLKHRSKAPKSCGCFSTRINKHHEDRAENQGQ